jgi:hypothetical protein
LTSFIYGAEADSVQYVLKYKMKPLHTQTVRKVQEVYTKGGMSGKLRKGHNRQGLRKNVK